MNDQDNGFCCPSCGRKDVECEHCADHWTIDEANILAQLRARLDVACHIKATDKVGFDWEILDTIAQLRAENAEMRKFLLT